MMRCQVVWLECEVVHVGAVGRSSVAHNEPEKRICVRLPDDSVIWIDAFYLREEPMPDKAITQPPADKAIKLPPQTQHIAGPKEAKRPQPKVAPRG